jgi:O-antigen ligase
MKWIVLAIFFVMTPILAAWLRTKPSGAPWIWGLLGFLPFVLGPWHLMVAPYATPMWPGYVKGWDISLLDAIAVAVLLGSRDKWQRPPLFYPVLAYIFAVAIAIPHADFAKLAFSYVLQLLRVLCVFLAVASVVTTERGQRAVMTGLVAGLALQAAYAIVARAGGALQTGGSLGHQNLLGFVSHLVLMPAFALFLAGRWKGLALTGLVSGIVVVILTASRATIAFSAIGLALTLLLSLGIRFTARKVVSGFVGLLLLAASFPLAQATLNRRFQASGSTFLTEDLEREAFARAARSMVADYPIGVGPNHYVLVANTKGYSARAGVAWRSASRATNVHNSYLLVAAETGYPGLLTMVGLLFATLWYAFAGAIRFRRQAGSEVLIGLGCGVLAMSIHGFFEWMFVVYPTQYLYAASMGLVAGLTLRYARRATQKALPRRAADHSDSTEKFKASGPSEAYASLADRPA